jgi:hypothetical protein
MMARFLTVIVTALVATAAFGEDPIRIEGPEQGHLSDKFPDGGLPPLGGVQNFQVFRACREAAFGDDGKGWTYNHHVDIACWKGRLYVAWENGQKDEDTFPAREVLASSADGISWSKPTELFPIGLTNTLRMDFYHAKNGKMLAIAARRVVFGKMTNATQGGVVVRELRDDGSLGPVFTLIASPATPPGVDSFQKSGDSAFVEACSELLADHTFLEEQDGGALLANQHMQPYENAPADFGKAFCFFHRPDGTLVGICKKGYVVTSRDDGATWDGPTKLQQFKAGTAKEWIQQIGNGQFIWTHDPFPANRYPLVMLTGNDGVTFRDMRVVHGEVPRQRYAGLDKNIGPQYVRGISAWTSDGSRSDRAIWLAYSVNKEDIWVSRIPLPIVADAAGAVDDEFANFSGGRIIPGWNTYCPKWTDVSVSRGNLRLEDHDPYDYALAQRVFPALSKVTVESDVTAKHLGPRDLEIELWSEFGDVRPVRIDLESDGDIVAAGKAVGRYSLDRFSRFRIDADAGAGSFDLSIDGGSPIHLKFEQSAGSLDRIVFRTGAYRGLPVRGDEIKPGTDRPTESSEYLIGYLRLK